MAEEKRGSAGGKAVKEKYGTGYLVNLGKKGFQATTDLYFGGDRKAHLRWLQRKGLYTIDKDATYGQVYADPGPHPAQLQGSEELLALRAWLQDAEAGLAETPTART